MDSDQLFTIYFLFIFYGILFTILCPIVLGIWIMGLQKRVLIKHAQSGLVANGYVGYCWTYLFLGPIIPIFRGEIVIGALYLFFTGASLGLFQLFMPLLYNKQFMVRHLTNGYALSDKESVNLMAKKRLGIAL